MNRYDYIANDGVTPEEVRKEKCEEPIVRNVHCKHCANYGYSCPPEKQNVCFSQRFSFFEDDSYEEFSRPMHANSIENML